LQQSHEKKMSSQRAKRKVQTAVKESEAFSFKVQSVSQYEFHCILHCMLDDVFLAKNCHSEQ